jgi:hypothetical protein
MMDVPVLVAPMKRALVLASAIVVLIATACSSLNTGGKVWYKENGTTEERDLLLAAAKVQAQQAHVGPTLGGADTPEAHRQSEVEATMTYMTAHGWQLVPPSEAKRLRSGIENSATPANTVSAAGIDR